MELEPEPEPEVAILPYAKQLCSFRSDGGGLFHIRRRLVRYTPGGEEEQRDKRALANTRIVMCARPRRRPSSSPPSVHALQLGRLVDLDDAVDLAVGVRVVLAREDVLALHVHGGDAEEARLRTRHRYLAAPVHAPVAQLRLGDPSLREPPAYEIT